MPSFLEFSALTTPVEAGSPLVLARYHSIVEFMPQIRTDGEFADEFGSSRMTGTSSGLDVSAQKNLQWPVQVGVADSDATQRSKGLQAVEAALAWRTERTYEGVTYPSLGAGGYPAQKFGDTSKQNRFHNKCMFLDRGSRAVKLALDGGFTTYTGLSGSNRNISLLKDQLETSALWAASTSFYGDFLDEDGPFNQRMGAIAFLQTMGSLLGNSSLETAAREGLEQILAERTLTDDEGLILQEKASRDGRGFDSGYQTLSMELLACYYLELTAGAWKTSVLDVLQRAINKFVARVDPVTGAIDTSTNTRTEPQGPRVLPGIVTAKGLDIDIIPWRMRLMAYVTGNSDYNDLGDLILAYGQGYGHISDDEDDDGDGSGSEFIPENLSLYGQSIGGSFQRFIYPTVDSVESALSPNFFQSDPMKVRPGDLVDVVASDSLDRSERTAAEGLTVVITDTEGNAARLTPEEDEFNPVTSFPRVVHTGGTSVAVGTAGTDTTPSVTETYHVEIGIPVSMVLHGIAFLNGSAAAGNIKGYLCDSGGNVLASTVSTAASGTNDFQRVAFTSPYLCQPGDHYVALQCSNTSHRFRTHVVGTFGAGKDTGTVYGTLLVANVNTTFVSGRGPIATLF